MDRAYTRGGRRGELTELYNACARPRRAWSTTPYRSTACIRRRRAITLVCTRRPHPRSPGCERKSEIRRQELLIGFRLSSAVAQPLLLSGEEPPIRVRRGEVGGAFELRPSGIHAPEPAQHRPAGRVQQVVALQLRRDRIERRERGAGALDLSDCDRAIQRDYWRRQDRKQLIVEGDDLAPVGGLDRLRGGVNGLDRGLQLVGPRSSAADTRAH